MIIIFGYLKQGNYGDEILADLLTSKLREKHGDLDIERLCARDSIWQHLKLLYKAEKIYGIGGMFQDLSGGWSVSYYFVIFVMAYLMRVKIIVFAQGIGPINSVFNKLLTYWAMKLASKIGVRDSASDEMLSALGIEHLLVADWAWLYADEIIDINFAKLPKLNSQTKPLVLSLRPSKFINDEFLDMLATEIDIVGLPVISLVMQDCDEYINQKLIDKLEDSSRCLTIKAADYSPQDLIYFFKNYCSVMYAMRLHAAILGRIAGLELNLIDCDPKLVELSKQLEENDLDSFIARARLNMSLL